MVYSDSFGYAPELINVKGRFPHSMAFFLQLHADGDIYTPTFNTTKTCQQSINCPFALFKPLTNTSCHELRCKIESLEQGSFTRAIHSDETSETCKFLSSGRQMKVHQGFKIFDMEMRDHANFW